MVLNLIGLNYGIDNGDYFLDLFSFLLVNLAIYNTLQFFVDERTNNLSFKCASEELQLCFLRELIFGAERYLISCVKSEWKEDIVPIEEITC